MKRSTQRAWLAWAAVSVLAFLCGSLAILQYRWIGEISAAERRRLQEDIDNRLDLLRRSFNETILAACSALQPGAGETGRLGKEAAYESSYGQWKRPDRPLFRRLALAEIGVVALARFAEPLPPCTIAPYLAAIDRCCSADTVGEIAARLAAEPGDWAVPALKALRTVSPTALAFTLEAFRRGANMTLKDALDAEFLLTRTTMAYPDFAEGVRAMVVDKDRQPKWRPARIEDIDPAVIAGMFR
ncbi:MAG: enoyl-CoA hydratase/isomerase family protein [Acidobacteriia bacterium]|nr:enoyl-CoA hydratase/isomerase family protein [Terriglobia bacterium]